MQQTIEHLYNGEIFPCEDMRTVVEGYSTAVDEARVLEHEFREDLSESMKGKLDEIKEKRETAKGMEVKQAFVDGYKLGVRMTIEVYQ